MFSDYIEKMQQNPEAVVKQTEAFKSVMFTVKAADDKATVSVIQTTSTGDITIRVMKSTNDAMRLLPVCNEYNSHSANIITFVTQDKVVASRTTQDDDESAFMNIVAQLLTVLKVILK